MQKVCHLIILILIVSFNISAQIIESSISQKISNKTPYFKVLGKNEKGTYIYKYGRNEHEVELYNDKMQLQWVKHFSSDITNVEKIIYYPERIVVFYSIEDRNIKITKYKVYSMSMDEIIEGSEGIVLDTLDYTAIDNYPKMNIISSVDKNYILMYYYITKQDGQVYLKTKLIGKKLTEVDENLMKLPSGLETGMLEKTLVSNNGDIYFIFFEKKYSKNNSIKIVSVNKESKLNDEYNLMIKPEHLFVENIYQIDEMNHQIVCAGTYSKNNVKDIIGIFAAKIDLDRKNSKPIQYFLFNELALNDKNINSGKLKPEHLNLRYDGGIVIALEYINIDTRTITVPNLYGYYSTNTSTYYYYNDIVIISINPDGIVEWKTILPKEQVSESDNGYYSSFMVLNTQKNINIIFNERISTSSDVIICTVDVETGEWRKKIIDMSRAEIFIVPQYGVQTTPEESIIPSINRNYLKLLRFNLLN